jgi:hypothetical protein
VDIGLGLRRLGRVWKARFRARFEHASRGGKGGTGLVAGKGQDIQDSLGLAGGRHLVPQEVGPCSW